MRPPARIATRQRSSVLPAAASAAAGVPPDQAADAPRSPSAGRAARTLAWRLVKAVMAGPS